jgi:hypothetical protein
MKHLKKVYHEINWVNKLLLRTYFGIIFSELGNVETLRSRFKKRENVRPGRYVPQRLKVSANGEGSQMSGYLRKKQKNNAKWKRMWFVLKDRVLYAYKAPDDSVASDTFPILGFVLETLSEVLIMHKKITQLSKSKITVISSEKYRTL